MQAFRNFFSWWNEVGLVVGFLIMIGYFGSRQIGGWLPLFALLLFLIAGFAFIVMLVSKSESGNEYGFSNEGMGKLDKGLIYAVCFIFGTAIFTTIGAVI